MLSPNSELFMTATPVVLGTHCNLPPILLSKTRTILCMNVDELKPLTSVITLPIASLYSLSGFCTTTSASGSASALEPCPRLTVLGSSYISFSLLKVKDFTISSKDESDLEEEGKYRSKKSLIIPSQLVTEPAGRRDHTSMSTSTSTPTTHNFDSSDFQEAVNKVVEEKLSEMRARLQKEMQTTIQATIEAMRSSQPPI
ncbi:uncharacterized protein G2W53_033466 [Senna tora]|uniref:Uncharacterized protein n=1 Tax=Senna tora TaxID=362788 RepID=A0A834T0M2_9FABA|nr:uncharacterized protein G2W53_033466 [Senna tora]